MVHKDDRSMKVDRHVVKVDEALIEPVDVKGRFAFHMKKEQNKKIAKYHNKTITTEMCLTNQY